MMLHTLPMDRKQNWTFPLMPDRDFALYRSPPTAAGGDLYSAKSRSGMSEKSRLEFLSMGDVPILSHCPRQLKNSG